jgi:hypothetical protein
MLRGPQRDIRTNQNVDFVGSPRTGGSRCRAGQVIACGVSNLLRGLDARDISHGPEEAQAFPLEREKWESSAASCCGALVHGDARAAIQALRQCATQEGPGSVVIATQVPVRRTCTFGIM